MAEPAVLLPHDETKTAEQFAACRYKDKWPQRSGGHCQQRISGRNFNVPTHVKNCANNGGRAWWIWSWKKSAPLKKTRRPYTCGSWRCPGECAKHNSHVLFARLRDGVRSPGLAPQGWCFLVLTIDRNGYYSGKPWKDAQVAYRALSAMSRKFMKRLRRGCAKRGWADPGNRWAMVIEAHMSGWPHANLMVYSPELACALRTEAFDRELAGKTGREAIVLGTRSTPTRGDCFGTRAWLGEHAVATDWGLESTADGARDVDALAGYLVKMAGNPDANIGELAKLTQVPLNAPFKFRRLRSGKGFLPKQRKNDEYTGALVKRMVDRESGYEFAMIPEPKGGHRPERLEAVQTVQRLESRCIEGDEERRWYERRSRPRDGPPAIPLVTTWKGEDMVDTRPEPTTWTQVRAEWEGAVRAKRLRKG